MPEFNTRRLLRLFLKDRAEFLIFEVREHHATRLRELMAGTFGSDRLAHEFFWFDTVDGKAVIINLECCQVIHFLWEPTELPVDSTRYDGPIEIHLRNRKDKLETWCASPDQLFDFFTDLERGPDVVPFPGFEDEDGEKMLLNATEIVMVQAPLYYLEEGRQMVEEEDEE